MHSIRAVTTTATVIAASIRERYLVSTEHAIYHSLKWLRTKLQDISYKNLNFQPPIIDNVVEKEGIGIYCVHGTADNMAAFEDTTHYLLDQGLPGAVSSIQLVAFENRARGVGIEEFAKQLLDKILANGHKTVILAGHSRGGLVNAYLYEYLARAAGIKVLFSFSIATPYGGSNLALPPLSWVSKSVQEMQKNSEFLKDLHKQHDKSHHYVCAAGDSDYIVRVNEANFNDKPPVVFYNQGHLSLMHDQRMLRLLRNTIREEVNKLVPCKIQSSPAELKEEEEYSKIELEPIPELWDIYFEISMYLEDFKRRIHINNTDEKILLFEKLQQMVQTMLGGKQISNFDNTKTFGEFLDAFLNDKSKPEKIPDTMIDQHLNSPFSRLFSSKETHSRAFINRLKTIYSNVALPLPINAPKDNNVSLSVKIQTLIL
jgi:pimeloyl-ACP methyl ester carboxylesterase